MKAFWSNFYLIAESKPQHRSYESGSSQSDDENADRINQNQMNRSESSVSSIARAVIGRGRYMQKQGSFRQSSHQNLNSID